MENSRPRQVRRNRNVILRESSIYQQSRLASTLRSEEGMTDRNPSPLAHSELTGRILECFYDAYGELGHGFSEAVLVRGMVVVLEQAGMQVLREAPLEVTFRGHSIGTFYADLIVDRTVLVEIKASATLEGYGVAQTLNYLKAVGGGVGLLLNFGRKPEFKRLVMDDPSNSLPALKTAPSSQVRDGP
jgi:GxxExxY protein